MPIDVKSNTTAPRSEAPSAVTGAHAIPLFAIHPEFPIDFLQGGCTVNSASVPLVNGVRMARQGDVFRRNASTGLWDLLSVADPSTPTDNGQSVVMLPHDLNCTEQGQSFNGVLRSLHVHKDALTRPIPNFLVGPGKPFLYKYRSPVNVD